MPKSFEIGQKVKWSLGQSGALCRGLYFGQINDTMSEIRVYENNNRPWNDHQEVLTELLEKE